MDLTLPSLQVSGFSRRLLRGVDRVEGDKLAFTPRTNARQLESIVGGGIARRRVLSDYGVTFTNKRASIGLCFVVKLPARASRSLGNVTSLKRGVISVCCTVPGEPGKGSISISVDITIFIPGPFAPFRFIPRVDGSRVREGRDCLGDRVAAHGVSLDVRSSSADFLRNTFTENSEELYSMLCTTCGGNYGFSK